jgi:hypothetical protein
MVQTVTSYDNAAVGSGNVVNQVQLVYNSFGQLVADYQSHAGPVNTSTTPQCQYAYANGGGNTTRLTSMIYPNSRHLNYDYGSSGGPNDAASRVASLIDNDAATHLADYSYLGQANIIQVNEQQPSLLYTLVGVAGGNDPVTGDIYQGLDLFGRVKDLIWTNGGTGSSSSSSSSSGVANIVERIQHGYDRAGNRTYRADPADSLDQHDELYAYDGLERLVGLQRGGLNPAKTALTSETFAQCWGLDATGNWSLGPRPEPGGKPGQRDCGHNQHPRKCLGAAGLRCGGQHDNSSTTKVARAELHGRVRCLESPGPVGREWQHGSSL